jgi:hypothetical protein
VSILYCVIICFVASGVSLEGSVVFARDEVNQRFYGRMLTPANILAPDALDLDDAHGEWRGTSDTGSSERSYLGTRVAPPRAAECLYDALLQVESMG